MYGFPLTLYSLGNADLASHKWEVMKDCSNTCCHLYKNESQAHNTTTGRDVGRFQSFFHRLIRLLTQLCTERILDKSLNNMYLHIAGSSIFNFNE